MDADQKREVSRECREKLFDLGVEALRVFEHGEAAGVLHHVQGEVRQRLADARRIGDYVQR